MERAFTCYYVCVQVKTYPLREPDALIDPGSHPLLKSVVRCALGGPRAGKGDGAEVACCCHCALCARLSTVHTAPSSLPPQSPGWQAQHR